MMAAMIKDRQELTAPISQPKSQGDADFHLEDDSAHWYTVRFDVRRGTAISSFCAFS